MTKTPVGPIVLVTVKNPADHYRNQGQTNPLTKSTKN